MLRTLLEFALPKNPPKSPSIVYSPFLRQISTAAKNAVQRTRQQAAPAPLQISISYPASNARPSQHNRLFDSNNPENITNWIKKYFEQSGIDTKTVRIARAKLDSSSMLYGFDRDALFQRNVVLFPKAIVENPKLQQKFNILASGRTTGRLIPTDPVILCWQATFSSGFMIYLAPHLGFKPGEKLKQQPDEKSGIRLKK